MDLFVGYPFISAYLLGEESKVITHEHLNRMSRASSVQDVLGVISETDIGNYFEKAPVNSFGDIDEYLWRYFDERLRLLEWFKLIPSDVLKLVKAYIVKYDVLNIKAALEGITTGKKARSLPIGIIYNYRLLDELFSAQDVDSVVRLLNKCKMKEYASIIEGYKIDGGIDSSLLSQSGLDSVYYKNLLEITKKVNDGSKIAEALGIMIDMTNLQVIIRAIISGTGVEAADSIIAGGSVISEEVGRELLALKLNDLPGKLKDTLYYTAVGEIVNSYIGNKNIGVIGVIIDKHKAELTKEILSRNLMSLSVVAWYLILKEFEIRNLRLILKAMVNNLSVEEIKNSLVFV